MNNRYGLTALGMVNALGDSKDVILANLMAGHAPGMCRESGWLPAGEVDCAKVTADLPCLAAEPPEFQSRNNQLLLAALLQIRPQVDAAIQRFGAARVGVVIGSSTSGIAEGERALAASERPADYHYRQQEIGAPALFVAQHLKLDGPCYTVSTACSSSAKAFAAARNLLALNLCDAVIVGGADSLCKLTLNGFTALESVSAQRCKPFSENRDGITIGEAAALFLLECEAAAINLLGVGESADAHHISAPHPEGDGAAAAMQAALDDAGLRAADIGYLNLHGTATPKNDLMESKAVHRVLGDDVPCSSTKALVGHTLGAAGATEVGLCWLLLNRPLEQRQLPPQVWDGQRDPALAPIALLTESRDMPAGREAMMSNSFAFGGSNACVIIGRL
jgi:3-oxoacyl-[acyl-carrier-protein] synthase-1